MWQLDVNWNESEMQSYGVIQATSIRQLISILSKQLEMSDLVYEKDESVKMPSYVITSPRHPGFYMMAVKYN